MSIKQSIKMKETINFEADQQDLMKKTDNIQSLADQVERLELCNNRIADIEADLKMMKKQLRKHWTLLSLKVIKTSNILL